MGPLSFGTQVCGSLDESTQREWLVTDGLGGYAMGTVAGLRTRRYHGLLMVAGDVPARRMLGLASLDPIVTLPSGSQVRLATHEWATGVIAPTGFALLERFELRDGLPRWRWRIGDVVVERTVAARYGSPGVAVVDRVLAGGPVTLSVEALCTWRDAHGERHASDGLAVEPAANGVLVEGAYRVAGPSFTPAPEWYLGVHHREEAARGLAAREDLLRVGSFTATLGSGEALAVSAWAVNAWAVNAWGAHAGASADPPPAEEVVAEAQARYRALSTGPAPALRAAADAFIVRTSTGGPDVVAGYPWFGAWSRDTMISYAGLFLATGRADEGRELLRSYGRTLSQGMLANTADTGQVEYNTADATLWFLHAVERHVRATADTDLAAEVVAPLLAVIGAHVTGTRYGIGVDQTDGLLTQGADGYALTWMDAVVHGTPITPRRGKAVELNALWINGLAALGWLCGQVGRDAADLDRLRAQAQASFVNRYPSRSGWLHDVVDGPDGDDAALRPNQLLAFGLPYAPLRGGDPAVVRRIGRALLTPLGLRSLAPDDPAYAARHRGDPAGRDRAYHQGTVWPWLLGPYGDAARAVGLTTDDLLDGILAHLREWGLGSVSETADGDAPHAATGCPFQAWSVAEPLRLLADAAEDRS